MGQIISRTDSGEKNQKKSSNSHENKAEKYSIIDAYDEQDITRITFAFDMHHEIEAKWKWQELKKEHIELEGIDSRRERNPSDEEKHEKILNNGCTDRDHGYREVISHLKLVIATAKGEDISSKCHKRNYKKKSKCMNRRDKIQTTLL